MRWYDGWPRSPGTGFRQSLLRSRRVQPPPDQGPFAFGPSRVLQWISPSDLLGLWRALFTERQTRWQFELVKRCSGRPWCVRKTKLWHPSQHTLARSLLYRSLRCPILMRTALVSARKHENLEDLFVSLFSLFEYISRTFSTRCSFVPGVARSQWSVVHGQCARGKTRYVQCHCAVPAFELNFIVSCMFGPAVDTRACVRSGRLLTLCEYISCHCKRCARAPWFWSSCVCPLVDYTKSDLFPYLPSSQFGSGYWWIYWEMSTFPK